MGKYLRITSIAIFLIIILSSFAFCEEESYTITTYYPSPYGVYKNLRIYPNDDNNPGAACTNAGEMYYDNSEQNLYICSGNVWKLVPGRDSIPSGMIAIFATSCPAGWTRFAALDGRFPKGAATYGTSGGSTTHTHTASGTTASSGSSGNQVVYGQASGPIPYWYAPITGGSDHTHAYSGATSAADHTPPYITVIWCQKN